MKSFATIILMVLALTSVRAGHGQLYNTPTPGVLEVSIQEDNLFLHAYFPCDQQIEKMIIYLNKGRRLDVRPLIHNLGESVFYLNSKQAFKLKKYGIKSVTFKTVEDSYHIKLSENEVEKISRSLP